MLKKAGGGIARLPLKSPSPRQPPAEPQTLVVPVFFPLYPPTWKPLPPPGSCQPSVPLSSGDTVPVTSPIFIFQSTPIGDFPSNQAPGGLPLARSHTDWTPPVPPSLGRALHPGCLGSSRLKLPVGSIWRWPPAPNSDVKCLLDLPSGMYGAPVRLKMVPPEMHVCPAWKYR